jgi:hypothetical protein
MGSAAGFCYHVSSSGKFRSEGDHGPYVYLDGLVLKRSWAGEIRKCTSLLLVVGFVSAFFRLRHDYGAGFLFAVAIGLMGLQRG